MEILENIKLSSYTTIHLGGNAKKIYFPKNETDLLDISKLIQNKKTVFLGNGSNIAFKDKGYSGNIISFKNYNKTLKIIDNHIVASAGVSCSRISKFANKNSISGYEFFHGIPGTIGGAMAMNAGAFQKETWDMISSYQAMDKKGLIKNYKRDDLKTSYRNVDMSKIIMFLEANFKISKKMQFNKNLILKFALMRQSSQPVRQWSSGCIFKNPNKSTSASRLIEKIGLKSTKMGGIYISKKHSNYFINDGTGTCADLEELIGLVKYEVKKKYKMSLHNEIHIY
ncbi:MAG: UDP-N-acetylmuramate dehydrogenase [Pelagibacterales bacterium]|nr:UDP-N-acetylmuramate dehydrogenase [Pelagibacterales bacterium]